LTRFEELGIKNPILTALSEIHFDEPFPIQAAAIPVLLSGQDVIGQAHTGTGKTAAFSLPIIQTIVPNVEFKQSFLHQQGSLQYR